MPAGATSGSWSALHEALTRGCAGHVARGDVITEDSSGCYFYAESRLVSAVGLKDHVVVETKDAVLVAPKDRVQDVKKLVARLKAAAATSIPCTARCTGPGAATTASTTASASR